MTRQEFKELRKQLKLNQGEIATKLGVHRISVVKWETGAIPIDRRTEMAIEHLKCPKKRWTQEDIDADQFRYEEGEK